jgi:glycosyltransferase involved in cell wall biosynthesis/SAM-dependent methyltransferase
MADRQRDGPPPSADPRPCVSVIMIFFDARAFIAEAIESVVAQSYQSWELLLVDDGSTDGSTDIARRFAERCPARIRYLEHEGHANRGMSASRNAGIRAARGPLIAFLDADDVWQPITLEQQVATISAQPRVGMICGPTEIWHSWTGDRRDADGDYVRRLGTPTETLYEPPHLLSRFLAGEARPPATCSLLARRSALELVGGFEERFRGLHEDQVMFAKLCCAVPIYVSSACWGRYRQHAGSCCARAATDEVVRREQDIFLTWLVEYVAERRFNDPEVRWLVEKRLWRYRHRTLGGLLDRARPLGRRAFRVVTRLLGDRPRIAYEPELIPPHRLRRRGDAAVDEGWFRRGHEWALLLRLFGALTPTSHVLELGGELGQIAYALRHVLSADGSYTSLAVHGGGGDLLAARYRYRYPNFRFDRLDMPEPRDAPDPCNDASDLRFPYPDSAFDLVFSARALGRLEPPAAACLREAARVLKAGGRCVFGVLLLDQYRPGQPRPAGFAGRTFEIDDRATPGFAATSHPSGEQIVAYRQHLLQRLAADVGLVMDRAPIVGSWSGTRTARGEAYDLLVLRRPPSGEDGATRAPFARASDPVRDAVQKATP